MSPAETAAWAALWPKGWAESGADLFLIATNASSLEKAAAEISKTYGVRCEWAAADITDETQVEKAVGHCMDVFGKIDILINNAGTDRVPQSPEEADLAKWRRVIEINVTGPFIVAAGCRKAHDRGRTWRKNCEYCVHLRLYIEYYR